MNHLLQLSAQLVIADDPEEVLPTWCAQLVTSIAALEAAILWLVDPLDGTLRIAALDGVHVKHDPAMVYQMRLRSNEGIVGAALRQEQPLVLHGRRQYREVSSDVNPRTLPVIRALTLALPRQMTATIVPLRVDRELVGLLELFHASTETSLSPTDLAAIESVAAIATSAIKHAQIRKQLEAYRHRLEVFGAIGTAISSASDLEDLLDNALRVLLAVVEVPSGALLLYDQIRNSLALRAECQMPVVWQTSAFDIAVAGSPYEEAVRYGQPVRRPLLAEREEQLLLDSDFHSCVYLPLLAGGTVVGVVAMFGDQQLLDRVDVPMLMTIANQIGFAIANVTLYQESQVERRKLTTIINSIAEGVAICDGQGRLVLVNERARRLLSLEAVPYPQTLSDMPDFYGVRDLEDRPLTSEYLPLSRALSGEVFHDYRVKHRRASGEDTALSFSGAPIVGADGRIVEGAVVVFRDVTEYLQHEQAKDDFLAVAAHELRSPLAAIRTYADLLLRREQQRGLPSNDLRGFMALDQQVSHLIELVDNLLDMSRLDADQFNLDLQPVDLVTLLQQVITQQRASSFDRQFIVELEPEELLLSCDKLRIRQILVNLLSNAVRYSPHTTPIMVSMVLEDAADIAHDHPEFREWLDQHDPATTAGRCVLIAVEDQGNGISDEQRRRIFKRYGRGERRGEGLGLGLYLSRELALRHGGTIWFENQPVKGCTFYLVLPLG